MDSLWRETVKLPRFEPLEGDFTTDVLVIGGGLAGLLQTSLPALGWTVRWWRRTGCAAAPPKIPQRRLPSSTV
jgi:hypothetical protein